MRIVEIKVKQVIVTKKELADKGEWLNFLTFYQLEDSFNDQEEFIIAPLEAAMFGFITSLEAMELDKFYTEQLKQNDVE